MTQNLRSYKIICYLQVLEIRVTSSVLVSPRCHQVAEILKAVSPLLCLQLQTGCSAPHPNLLMIEWPSGGLYG
jgi:hypothetical protein